MVASPQQKAFSVNNLVKCDNGSMLRHPSSSIITPASAARSSPPYYEAFVNSSHGKKDYQRESSRAATSAAR